ncbi:MATE efflux family protein [Deinococcus aerius]|uniref:MATE efflux family protein n=2 Tax=Deinococcus aerius TaxID=200253 RepID=A0A2I9DHQ3_9DEIO|nr:MATE efflux family protein [Deinococcus aerius]
MPGILAPTRYPAGMTGWLGALLLILAGYGWGARMAARQASPVPVRVALLGTLGASVVGLALVIEAFLAHQDGPLTVGAVGALAAAALAVFTARE